MPSVDTFLVANLLESALFENFPAPEKRPPDVGGVRSQESVHDITVFVVPYPEDFCD